MPRWENNGVFFCLNQAAQSTEKPKRTVGSPASGQTNEGGKSSLLHTDRECGIILEKTLYGKDKHDECSGYYETPCRLRQRL